VNFNRRHFLGAAAAATAFPAFTQAWPSQVLKIVVPFAAGGPTDFVARSIATHLSQILGQPVVVENRPGASGNLGAQAVAEAAPDGYTLVHTTAAMQAVNPLMYSTARFNITKHLVPLGMTAALPNLLVINPAKHKFHTAAELVAKARERPNALSYATFGNGTSPHVYGALLEKVGKFDALAVPYKGSAPAATDLLGGQIDFLFDSATTSLGQVQSGKLKALAITSSKRSPLLPDVPTMREAGFAEFDLQQWFALQAPATTPRPIVDRLRVAIAQAAADKRYQKSLVDRGAEPVTVAPADVEKFALDEARKWTEVARLLNLKPE
jgi:tripartite-type tricarboxylate transporter receptor subunit TctC